jgi:hypothetical protein
MVPDLKILEKAGRRFFSHFHIDDISCFLVGEGDEVIISQEGKEADDEHNENQRDGQAIEANSSCFKSGDLTVAGKGAEGEEGGQENRVGDRPLKGCRGNHIEKIFEYQVEGRLVSMEKIYLLEEEHHDIDQNQTAQAQAKDLQVFPYHVSVEDAMTIKHLP